MANPKPKLNPKTGQFMSVWNPRLERRVVKLYVEQGWSMRRVAADVGLAHSTVQQYLEEKDLVRRKRGKEQFRVPFLKEHAPRIKALYLKHCSPGEIARELGCTRIDWIAEYVAQQSWARSREETHKLAAAKRGRSMNQQAIDRLVNTVADGLDFEEYRYLAHKLTNCVWSRYKKLWPKHHLRSRYAYHLDHRYSIANAGMVWDEDRDCAVVRQRPMPFKYLCHPANLQLVPCLYNLDKNNRSDVSFTELKNLIAAFEAEHGSVFDMCYI